MRFLDLDLDFFLNKNAYASGHIHGRLGPEYQPWTVYRVRHFLETRCGLSNDMPVPGRTVKNHDEVLVFWRALIKSGSLKIPFDVIHIDAHPDMRVGGGLYLTPGCLHVHPERELAVFKMKPVHEGNFLTYALARGWVQSLIWVPLYKYEKKLPVWDADARTVKARFHKEKALNSPAKDLPGSKKELDIPYQILPWNKFRTREKFDYAALSRSPGFTPPESDVLIAIIEKYMKQM
jgi:hypothetical protein